MTRVLVLLQAHLFLIESVSSLVLLGLGCFTFLPDHYMEMLVSHDLTDTCMCFT